MFSEIIALVGQIPLPPYIQREANETDKDRYQTTYATTEGSVAAPTAGLHFDEHVFKALAAKGIDKNLSHSMLVLEHLCQSKLTTFRTI